MKKKKFELDLKYENGNPIGMDPDEFQRNYDNHELYFQFLNNWKPNTMRDKKDKVKTNPSKVCVTLS